MSATIVGVGAVTAIGLSAPATMAAQRAGISGQAEHPYLLDRNGEPMRVAAVPWGDADGHVVERLVELGLQAAREALASMTSGLPVDILLGLPEARPGLPDGFAADIVKRFAGAIRDTAALATVKVLAQGHASGLALIGEAAKALQTKDDRFVLVGGVDTWLAPETLEWLDAIEALHSDTMPWGFCPGEAAAFCLLSSAPQPQACLAILGSGHAIEANRIRTETVCIGTALSAAWRDALCCLDRSQQQIDQIWCDLNSEPYRADELALTVTRVRERLVDNVNIVTPSDTWGDVGAASGPLLLVAAEAAAAKNYASGPLSLFSTSSDAGTRAAAVAYDPRRVQQRRSS